MSLSEVVSNYVPSVAQTVGTIVSMHYVNNEDKTRQAIQRFIVYGVLGAVVFSMSFLLVLAVRGYDIDRSTGQVINNGLIVIESDPRDATVYVNGVEERSTTPTELPLPEGDYEIRIKKDGYLDWVNTISLDAFAVNRINYPLLLPEQIETNSFGSASQPSILAIDPSGEQLIIGGQSKTLPRIRLFQAQGTAASAQSFDLRTVLTQNSEQEYGTTSMVGWRADERALFLRHFSDDIDELVLIDLRNHSNSRNLNTQFNNNFADVVMSGNTNRFLDVVDGDARLHRLQQNTSELLLPNATQVHEADNQDIFVINNDGTRLSRSQDDGTTFATLVDDIEKGAFVATTRFDGSQYVALRRGANQVVIYRDMQDSLVAANTPEKIISTNTEVASFEFTAEGQFLLVQSEDEQITFDLATNNEFDISLESVDRMGWLDGHRLYAIRSDMMYLLDFDGTNLHEITSAIASHAPIADGETEYIYSVSNSSITGQNFVQRSDVTRN